MIIFPKVNEIEGIVKTHKESLINNVLSTISYELKTGLGLYPLRVRYYTDKLSDPERVSLGKLCESDIIPFIKDHGWDIHFNEGARCFVFTISPATKGE